MTQQRVSPITVTSLLPATVTLSLQGALGQSANLVEVKNSSGSVLASVSSAGLASFPNLAVTSTTIPTNGVYLPAANTLGFATNSAVRMQIESDGRVGIGGTAGAGRGFALSTNITGSTTSRAYTGIGVIQSDVTTLASYFATSASTQAATFTLTDLHHYAAIQGTFGLNSTVSNQYGFYVYNSLTGATNNYGFASNIASGSNRWNFYASGTAANYFAGQTTVGSTSLTLGSSSAAQQFGVVSQAAANVGIVVRGAASQTGNLQEWQDSSGTVQSYIRTDGRFYGDSVLVAYVQARTLTGAYLDTFSNTDSLTVIGRTTTTAPNLIIKQMASQTGDMQQWRNSSGTVLAKVDATGNFTSTGDIYGLGLRTTNSYAVIGEQNSGGSFRMTKQTTTATNPGAGIGRLYFRDGTNAGTLKLVVIAGASGAETTILDNIPQT